MKKFKTDKAVSKMVDNTEQNFKSCSGTLCPDCGKPYIYTGDMPEGGWRKGQEPYCTCFFTKNPSPHSANQGWICPSCGRAISPFQTHCPFCGPNVPVITFKG